MLSYVYILLVSRYQYKIQKVPDTWQLSLKTQKCFAGLIPSFYREIVHSNGKKYFTWFFGNFGEKHKTRNFPHLQGEDRFYLLQSKFKFADDFQIKGFAWRDSIIPE